MEIDVLINETPELDLKFVMNDVAEFLKFVTHLAPQARARALRAFAP